MSETPEALRLADCLEGNAKTPWTREEAADELRCLHAESPSSDADMIAFAHDVMDAMIYTAPQPTRQRLADGELDLIRQKSPIKANYADLTALVRAVEKAHGIGGEA